MGQAAFTQASAAYCHECVAGKFQSIASQVYCLDCGHGRYQPAGGATACITCPAGKFARDAHTACSLCVAGRYQHAAGSNDCIDCEKGTFSAEVGLKACPHCPAGKFQHLPGNGTCLSCPSGKFQPQGRQERCSECASCDWTANQEEQTTCKPHPVDCVISQWGAWGGCSSSCDAGFRTRERVISVMGTCGGIPCAHTRETKSCFMRTCPCQSMKCTLEEHTCKFGAERKWRGFPQFNKQRFDAHFRGNCDGRKHYSIRVHHTNSERYGMGHHCKIVDQASKLCLCLCHDQYRSDADGTPLLEPALPKKAGGGGGGQAGEGGALSPVAVAASERPWASMYASLVQHSHEQAARVSSSAAP